jgi:4-amino-4-deoxy-L-arabinose transferase-like glycosyltransferase
MPITLPRVGITAWHVAGVAGVLVVALIVRLVQLGSVPVNVTADEADFLQNVYHILEGTGPGPFGFDWTPSPALVGIYPMAACVKLFSMDIWGVRMYPVLVSTATLIPFFLLARTRLSYWASLLATLLLATSLWYLHFSRTAWTNINGDLFAVAGALMLFLAVERNRWYYYVGAGVFAALGVYGYFSARLILLFFLAYLPIALYLFPDKRWAIARGYALMIVTCLLVFAPQIKPVVEDWDKFNHRATVTSILNQEGPYLGDTALGWKLVHQTERALRAFVLIDDSEQVMQQGLWARYVPPERGLLDGVTRWLFFLGLVVGLWRWRATALWWLMFLGPVLSVQVFTTGTPDAARGLIAAPFMFLFVGVALDALLAGLRRIAPAVSWAEVGLSAGLLAVAVPVAVFNVQDYWNWMHEPAAIEARGPAVTQDEFPEWRLLQQEAARRDEFGFTVGQWRSRQDRGGCLVGDLPAILCEGSTARQEPIESDEILVDAAARDRQRRADLDDLAAALAEYARRSGQYPDTGGSIQTLCAYEDLDAGCQLREVLDPLPVDPLGESTRHSYWYSSNGRSFTLYAGLESPPSDEDLCPAELEHLGGVEYLYCLRGP